MSDGGSGNKSIVVPTVATVAAGATAVAGMYNIEDVKAFLREFGLPVTIVVFAGLALAGTVYSICKFLAPLVAKWFEKQYSFMDMLHDLFPSTVKTIDAIKEQQDEHGKKLDTHGQILNQLVGKKGPECQPIGGPLAAEK